MTKYFLTIATFVFILVSCNRTQKTPGGLEYKIFTSNQGEKIGPGSYVYLKLIGKAGDSVIYNTYKNTEAPYMIMNLKDNVDAGNFEEGLTLLTKGDSAMFKINADSFFRVNLNSALPPFIKKGSAMVFYVKIDSFLSKKQLSELQAQQQVKINEQMKVEAGIIDEYVNKTGLKFEKTASGLRFHISKPTNGALAEMGDLISANYAGRLLDGTEFDSNKGRGIPLQFQLGAHQVISGWDEIFSILHVGEKATIVVPSSLGYGPDGREPKIPANATLVFDVELVKFDKK